MNFQARLEERIAKCGNPICLGMDPVLKLIDPCCPDDSAEDKIKRFYSEILECALKRNVQPAVVKPNSAYYECVSVQAMLVLQQLIADYRSAGIPVILDAKRGDIGKSSAAYATAAYDVYKADAVTVSPWMGADSVGPFIRSSETCADEHAPATRAPMIFRTCPWSVATTLGTRPKPFIP